MKLWTALKEILYEVEDDVEHDTLEENNKKTKTISNMQISGIKVGTTLQYRESYVKCNECCVAVDITRAYDLNV